MCALYQTAMIGAVLYDVETDNATYQFEPTEFIQYVDNEPNHINKEIRSGLKGGRSYRLEITVESFDMVRSKTKTFSKSANFNCVA